jgi:branched-chain amino acid transport system substrate-binding protein
MRRIATSALALAIALFACSKKQEDGGGGTPAADAKGPIKVGEVGSMTGTEATFGISSHRGIQLRVDEVNASGGVKSRQIQVIALDDQGKPEEAATATTRLIASEHVIAVLGEVASTRSMFMADKCQPAKVPMVTPSSTNPRVTEKGDYIFRACFIDPFQGYVMAKFATSNLHLKKVAVLKDVRNDYSVGLAENFTENFKKMGGQVIATESYSNGDVDFKAQLTKMKAQAPEALYVPGYYTDVGLIARQAREVGMTTPLLGGDGWDSEKLYEIGGDALLGCYFSNHYSVDDPSPRIQEFVAKFKKTYGGQLPDSLAAQAYDAAGMLVDAMNRAPELTGPAIRDALAQTKGYHGVTGDITLDEKRNPLKPAVVLRVAKGGKYEFVTKVYPEGMAPEAQGGPPGTSGTTQGGGAALPSGNTAPNAVPGTVPTPTQAPAVGATSPAQAAATSGQPQGSATAQTKK